MKEKGIEDIKHKTKKVVLEIIPNVSLEDLSDESNLFSLGLLSIDAMTLVDKLEDAFDVRFSTREINFENFQSLATLVELIEKKKCP
jgi:acyl carrier protein